MAEGIAKYREALQDGNPAELWEARGEGLWKERARPEEGLAGEVRPRPRAWRGQGRVRAVAALLPRRRPGDGPRDAPRVVHGHAAGLHARPMPRRIRSARHRPQVRHRGAGRLRHVRVARHQDERRDARIRRNRRRIRLGEKMFYFRGGLARLRVRDLSRRGRQAHPAAGPAQPDRARRARRRPTRRGPRIAYRRASCARSSGACNDCFRQQRFPELEFTSDASIALTMFLARNANGAAFDAPAIKR